MLLSVCHSWGRGVGGGMSAGRIQLCWGTFASAGYVPYCIPQPALVFGIHSRHGVASISTRAHVRSLVLWPREHSVAKGSNSKTLTGDALPLIGCLPLSSWNLSRAAVCLCCLTQLASFLCARIDVHDTLGGMCLLMFPGSPAVCTGGSHVQAWHFVMLPPS